jgi:crotonobetainyl-CoA:carnitine CoA-transferase CaiB-like acyl-CoA transferase
MTMLALEWGGSTAVRQCGMLLAALGIRVVHRGSHAADPNGVPDAHLDRRKEMVEPGRLAGLLAGADLLITDGSGPVGDALAAGVDVVAITPFGLSGPAAGAPGGDLIASHAGGYAHYLTWSVDDPDREPPTRGPQGQAQLVAGLTAAVAAASRLAGRARAADAHVPEVVDVAEMEAVTTLLLPQLSEHTEGTLKHGRRRARGGSKVAGGLVGLLTCADGHVIVSPREEHQWQRLMGIVGDPAWGADAGAATPALRMANWEDLQRRLGEWTSRHGKEHVFRLFQEARIPCFPVNRVADALALAQLDARGFWHVGADGTRSPELPFARREAYR